MDEADIFELSTMLYVFVYSVNVLSPIEAGVRSLFLFSFATDYTALNLPSRWRCNIFQPLAYKRHGNNISIRKDDSI